MEKLYDKKEAAKLLRISVESLGRLLCMGQIRYARVTPGARGKIVIPESSLLEYLDAQMNKAEIERHAKARLKSWRAGQSC